MPQAFDYETAITIDHETGIALVDTTLRSIAARLLRRGFTETTKVNSFPYRRFIGQARQITFLGHEKRRSNTQGLRLANQRRSSIFDARTAAVAHAPEK